MSHAFAVNKELRSLDTQELIEHFPPDRAEISVQDSDTIPVLVCAHNEEEDLAITLASIWMSDTNVLPVVVDNGSRDNTANIASEMGAITLSEPSLGKAKAIKKGLSFITQELGSHIALLTDADTIVGSKWAGSMSASLLKSDGKPAVTTGISGFTGGYSKPLAVTRTVKIGLQQAYRYMSGQPPITPGYNQGLLFDKDGELLDLVHNMDVNHSPGEDETLRDMVLSLGGVATISYSPDTFVLTKNDRVKNWQEYINLVSKRVTYRDLYVRDYSQEGNVSLQ